MSVVRNAHRRELYNCEGREGRRGNLSERKEEGREIFFHCMPAAALITWSVSVKCFTDRRLCR